MRPTPECLWIVLLGMNYAVRGIPVNGDPFKAIDPPMETTLAPTSSETSLPSTPFPNFIHPESSQEDNSKFMNNIDPLPSNLSESQDDVFLPISRFPPDTTELELESVPMFAKFCAGKNQSQCIRDCRDRSKGYRDSGAREAYERQCLACLTNCQSGRVMIGGMTASPCYQGCLRQTARRQ